MGIRTVSGVVYIGLIIGALLWGPTGIAILSAIFAVVASYEFESKVFAREEESRWMKTWLIDAAMLCCLTLGFGIRSAPYSTVPFIIWPILLLIRFVCQIFLKQPNPVKSIAISMLTQFYIGMPLMLLTLFVCVQHYAWLTICLIAMIWINDTGAYLVGCSIGRHKMFPTLSPKKSWEGFLGGVLFNIGAAFIYFYCFRLDYYPILSNVQGWIFIGICISAMATLGDLFESMLKRSLGIKDFGNIIPGHGGVLDRIDSLLFVVPGVLLLVGLATDMFI